jgi:EAL domain-containing protein (putative c-di-GMP-specific phosphodiesterase class I)
VSLASVAATASGYGHRLRGSVTPAELVLRLGAAAVVASLFGVALTSPAAGLVVDDVAQLAATAAAAIALCFVAARPGPAARRYVAAGLLLALVCAGVGMLVWDLQPGGSAAEAGPADWLFVGAIGILAVTLSRAIFAGMERWRAAEVALDSAILLVASITVLGALWQPILDRSGGGQQAASALICSLLIISGPAAAFLALLHRGMHPRRRGPHAVLLGVVMIGVAWISWLTMAAQDSIVAGVAPADYAYSCGVLLCGFGGMTWDLAVAPTPRFLRYAQAAGDIFPLLAVFLCVGLEFTTPRSVGLDVVTIGTAGVLGLALLRQLLLTVAERKARRAEREASARLAGAIRERAAVLRSLARLEAGDTPEETARRICDEALRLDGVDNAVIRAFRANGRAVVVGVAGIRNVPALADAELSEARTRELAASAADGPWTETFGPSRDPHRVALYETGLRSTANAPLLWNDQIIGAIGLGTGSEGSEAVIQERLTTVHEFGIVAGALLGPRLAERTRLEVLRQSVAGVIDDLAFHPVFQPVVDLASGATIGYEALTRFDSGRRPDLTFEDAAAVGLGLELETACLRAAQRDAIALPDGTWLSLNVSPALAGALLPLIAALEYSERDIVIEITEHAPVGSYAGLKAALEGLRRHLRIAVDDAGAGYAGLQHILEIRPDIVKLDISLVRGVDADPIRRALISSMVTFGRETGGVLLAEGIETEAERATLLGLGVTLGQGYLLGRPAPIEAYCSTVIPTAPGVAPGTLATEAGASVAVAPAAGATASAALARGRVQARTGPRAPTAGRGSSAGSSGRAAAPGPRARPRRSAPTPERPPRA